MKKILFPTDFSETANNALLYALSLAESQDATVYVLHVYELPIINGGISAGLVQNVYDTVKFGQFENFKDNIPQLRKIAEENGLKIYNATRGGKLEVFERIELDVLFNKNLNLINK